MVQNLRVQGNFEVRHVDALGNLIEEIRDHNTILTIGKSEMARSIVADLTIGSRIDWMSIGLGSSTIVASNTILGSEYLKYGLGSITGSTTTTTTTNDTAFWIGSFGITASKTVNEAGLFNASGLNNGSMYARTCFANIVVASGDYILANWKIGFT